MPSTASFAAKRPPRCASSPPGHRIAGWAMGFCLFDSIAVAARLRSKSLGLDRVLVVDWDVHHGNGTQDMFYGTAGRIFSIHRWPFYPGTGDAGGNGRGRPRHHAKLAGHVRHAARRHTSMSFTANWRTSPHESSRNWCSSAPASTATR